MEKILLVLNGRKPTINTIDFACEIARVTGSHLTGAFIENVYFEYMPVGGIDSPSYFKTVKEPDAKQMVMDIDQAIRIFKEECEKNAVPCTVYIDRGEPMQEVIYESRFADMIIIDPEISFYNGEEPLPSHFVKEILSDAECPVLLSPRQYDGVDEVIFCYDGSPSSVFALKQFTYLLPEYSEKNVVLLEIDPGKETISEGHRRIVEWLKAHYPSVKYQSLKGDVQDELFTYFFLKTKKLIVMGAYGRSLLSNFFKKSSAEVLMRMVDLPLFITHH